MGSVVEKYPVSIGLHGFWGRPEDWNGVQDLFPHLFFAKDLYENSEILNLPLPEAAKQWGLQNLKKFPDGVILAGYSMGGRFALHVAEQFPEWVRGIVLLSVHPGGLNPEETKQREQWLSVWQKNFNELSLSEAERLWQGQETFSKTQSIGFRQDLSGAVLAQNLEKWSLMSHKVHFEKLGALMMPQVWLFGEDDVKFQKVSRTLKAQWPNKKIVNIKGAGHRLLLDAPKVVAEALKEVLDICSQKEVINEIGIH